MNNAEKALVIADQLEAQFNEYFLNEAIAMLRTLAKENIALVNSINSTLDRNRVMPDMSRHYPHSFHFRRYT